MFGWIRELLEIRYEFKERKVRLAEEKYERAHVCQSCEVLKSQLDRANREKDQLLRELLADDIKNETQPAAEAPQPVNPRLIPWKIKQQQLEAEDRAEAIKREAFKKEQEAARLASKPSTSELEKNLGVDHAS